MFLLNLLWTLPFSNMPWQWRCQNMLEGIHAMYKNRGHGSSWRACAELWEATCYRWSGNKTCIHWPLVSRGTKYGDTYWLLWILVPYPFKAVFKLLKNNLSREESIWGCNGIFFSHRQYSFYKVVSCYLGQIRESTSLGDPGTNKGIFHS